ncbi:MAG: PqqD family protein [Ruminococcus sp.]|nr:PqqD family protein [Ruminococcus sp.]
MKLKDNFITHQYDDVQILIGSENTNFKGIVQSNATAAFIVDSLKQETTREQIIEKMLEKYDASESVISSDVDSIISKLRTIGAIDE